MIAALREHCLTCMLCVDHLDAQGVMLWPWQIILILPCESEQTVPEVQLATFGHIIYGQ